MKIFPTLFFFADIPELKKWMKKMVTSPLWTKKKTSAHDFFFLCVKKLVFFTSKNGENENFCKKIYLEEKVKSGISAVLALGAHATPFSISQLGVSERVKGEGYNNKKTWIFKGAD